jgi:hypothetical protein
MVRRFCIRGGHGGKPTLHVINITIRQNPENEKAKSENFSAAKI